MLNTTFVLVNIYYFLALKKKDRQVPFLNPSHIITLTTKKKSNINIIYCASH